MVAAELVLLRVSTPEIQCSSVVTKIENNPTTRLWVGPVRPGLTKKKFLTW